MRQVAYASTRIDGWRCYTAHQPDGDPVGTLLVTDTTGPSAGEVGAIVVDPHHRRQGIGSALITAARTDFGDTLRLRLTREPGQDLTPATSTLSLALTAESLGFWRCHGMLTAWDQVFPDGIPATCRCAHDFRAARTAAREASPDVAVWDARCPCGHYPIDHHDGEGCAVRVASRRTWRPELDDPCAAAPRQRVWAAMVNASSGRAEPPPLTGGGTP